MLAQPPARLAGWLLFFLKSRSGQGLCHFPRHVPENGLVLLLAARFRGSTICHVKKRRFDQDDWALQAFCFRRLQTGNTRARSQADEKWRLTTSPANLTYWVI